MKVQIVKIDERDSFSDWKEFHGAIGIIKNDEHDFRKWYGGRIFFEKPLEIEGGINSAYFYRVKIKRVK